MATYRYGRVEVNPATRQLLVDGQPAPLGARAFDTLLALIERRERLVTKDELLELVRPELVVEENNVQVQVSALRRLLGQKAIATVPGRGYRFAMEETPGSAPSSSQSRSRNPREVDRLLPPVNRRAVERKYVGDHGFLYRNAGNG